MSVCHCSACRRRSGSLFSAQASFAREQATISGRATTYDRTSEEGFRARFHFCPVCGATVFYEIERRPGMVSVALGAFDEPGRWEPRFSVFDDRRPDWLGLHPSGEMERD